MARSISEYFYEPDGAEGHRCGYCGSKDTNISNGMWTHYLTCQDYRDLIDRGWRRSGKYCYKPVMKRTCCPLYTIRCDATQFRLSKSQKTVLKRMNDFLLHGRQPVKSESMSVDNPGPKADSSDASSIEGKRSGESSKGAGPAKMVRPGNGPDPTKPPCLKAKLIRKERRQQKTTASQGGAEPRMSTEAGSVEGRGEKSHAEKDNPPSPEEKSSTGSPAGIRQGRSVAGRVGGASASEECSEMEKHSPSFLDIGPDGKKPLEMFLPLPASDKPPAHRLEIKLIQSSPPSPEFKSSFKESYTLYKKYQMAIHHDEEDKCTEKQFRRFLCDSPLTPEDGAQGWPCGYGSYHQHYRLDGHLIMVGVVDILPGCLSSVYVYYDPDYNFLTPGVYSALRELETTRQLVLHCPSFKHYYMGYYVHTCQKMRYKGAYNPSYLLCPESYRFIPIEHCRPKLDASGYSRLNEEETEAEAVDSWLSGTLVLYQRGAMPYMVLKTIVGGEFDAKVREYAGFVGPKVASRMLLFLSS